LPARLRQATHDIISNKAGKGLPENRARVFCLRAEGFFRLDLFTSVYLFKGIHEVAPLSFLFLFVSRQEESLSGNG
jgi:hypothetical protein